MKKVILLLLLSGISFAYLDGRELDDGHAGDPPRGRHCGRCHTGGPDGCAAWFTDFPDYYTPGETYTISLHMSHPSLITWGFQMVVKDGSNSVINTLEPVDGNTMVSSGGYMNQTRPGVFIGSTGEVNWDFQWTAPSTDRGDLTFYASVTAGNNDDDDRGDDWCNVQRTTEMTSGIDEKEVSRQDQRYDIFDISGRYITTDYPEKAKLGRGVFLARSTEDRTKTLKLINLE